MSTLPPLVIDLALILIVAGITTLVFRRLRQPLILGYILAGFLTGPHMSYMPSVSDTHSIHTWSEIGVIFIMFTLGLEFSFRKIVKMGIGPIIAALCVIFSMITLGNVVGQWFGWSPMNSLFLGGMVAMSSTTVIYKALDELGMRQQKFAGVVLSVLILEDILGILLMVVLSAMAAVGRFEGADLVNNLSQLAFLLILWFVVGIFTIPLFLRRNKKWISGETLLIVSIGLCFMMVEFASEAGYSSALGAFMMGSILAETTMAEEIEKIVAPVKDLFGAIFFVSVGMLVDPAVLVAYWQPVLVITLVILIGQTIFGTCSFILSGQPLKVAMQCGFSLTQIGEFSFILASLGVSLGVTSEFLYPVVVAVSIITTFTTPYLIRAATPAYQFVDRLLPKQLSTLLNQKGEADRQSENATTGWGKLLRELLVIVGAFGVPASASIAASFATILPLCRAVFGGTVGNAICGVVTTVFIAFLTRPIVMKKMHSTTVKAWHEKKQYANLFFFALTIVVRFAIAVWGVGYIIFYLSPIKWYWCLLIGAGIVALYCIDRIYRWQNPISKFVKYYSLRLERTFLSNFRSREQQAQAARPGYERALKRHDIHLAQLEIPEHSSWGGKTLAELDLGRTNGVMVAAIIRGSGRINIPDGDTILFPGDRIEALGDDTSLSDLARRLKTEIEELTPDRREYRLVLEHFKVHPKSPFANQTLAKSHIRDEYQCMVIGFEGRGEDAGNIDQPTANRVIRPGDTIWLVGGADDLKRAAKARVEEPAAAESAKQT